MDRVVLCGVPVGRQTAVTSRPGDEGRRSGAIRTFLIADIRGYTRFTDEFGDEAASRLATAFAEIVAEAVEMWEGQLVELRGDEALCTFESPRASLRCAIELQQTFADEAAGTPDLPLRVGMGLDLGEAIPVGGGFRGAALNMAARLCAGAAAGEIRATDNLAHVAGPVPGLRYEPAGSERLKGIADEVEVVRVITMSQDPPGSRDGIAPLAGRSPEPLPAQLESVVPFAGRHGDLRWLRWHWRRARLGYGGVVEIVGPEGIGKTRLASELAVIAHREGAIVRDGAEHALSPPSGAAMHPTLVIVDDADRLPAATVERLDDLAVDLDGQPRLVVLTRAIATPMPAGQQRSVRELKPMSEAEVAAIVGLYATGETDPPVRAILAESGGVPKAAHRIASQWARATSLERMSESANRTSRERRGLREAEEELIGRYAEMELARERSSRYADDGAGGTSSPSPTHACPYKGLAAYEAADAGYYFGRERVVGELVAGVVGSSFVGLVGASGSGKSSALNAGLLPALADGVLPGSSEWIQVPMRPGTHPMRQLANALARVAPDSAGRPDHAVELLERITGRLAPAQRVLLVIDQFEEVFSSVEDERGAFIDLITEGRPGVKVVLAVRADQYQRCASYPRLARQLAADQVLVGPLRSEEVAAIVRRPAERVGLSVEPDLVDALIADLGTEPGAMPLLSTALLELWEARQDGRLTLAAYRTLGGVRGAVARLAESAFARLDPDEHAAARAVFMRLIGEGSDPGSIVRRRLSTAEIETLGDARVPAVIEKLTDGRLLTQDEGTVEVAHEALIREWPRLREWIEEDAEGRQVRLHLIGAAKAWEAGGGEDGDLYRGARLAAAIDWAGQHEADLNDAERAFLDASRMSAERAAERQRRTNRTLRGLLVGAGVLLVGVIGVGAVAWFQAAENAENASVAQVREISLTALALVPEDPELALLLAAEAVRLSQEAGRTPPPQALHALWSAHTADQSTTIIPGVGARAVAYSPDGSTLVVDAPERDDALVTLRDPSTGAQVGAVPALADAGDVQGIAYSPDGRWLGVATSGAEGGPGSVIVLDATTLEVIHELSAGHQRYDDVSLVDSGLLSATGSDPGDADVAVLAWDLTTGRERAVLSDFDFYTSDDVIRSKRAHSATLRPATEQLILGLLDVVAFHQPGLIGVTAPAGAELRCPPCADVRTAWSELLTITPDIIAASPNGQRVAVADVGRGLVTVFDLLGRSPAFAPVLHREPRALSWNADGTKLAVAGGESGVVVLDAASGAPLARMPSRGEPVQSVAFRPGSDELAAVVASGGLRIHRTHPTGGDLSTGGRQPIDIGVTADHVLLSLGSAHTQQGETVSTATLGGGIYVYDRNSGAELRGLDVVVRADLRGQVAQQAGAVAAIYENGSSVLVDAASFRELVRLPGCLGASGISSDGRYVVLNSQVALASTCAGASATSGIYESSSDTPLIDYRSERVRSGAISNEAGSASRRYAAVTASSQATDAVRVDIWDLSTRELLAVMDEETRPGFVAGPVSFSPDARYLAVGADGPRALVIDVEAILSGSSLEEATIFDHEVHAASVRKAVVTDDGTLVTAGGDGVYRFWDLATGQMTMEIAVSGVLGTGTFDFSPDFSTFYYEDAGGVIRQMPADVDEMIALATGSLRRTLTDAECTEFLHTEGCGSSSSESLESGL